MSINRYPGPKPFKTEEESLFFGRENDKAELYKYVFLHQVVTLFGVSGYGKSSLINAGIIPLIKTNNPGTICFEVRFGPYDEKASDATPFDKVSKVVKAYSLDKSPFLLGSYLTTDDSFWTAVKNIQLAHETTQFIFFFDQFEELFTYPAEQIQKFKEQLADVLYTMVPRFYRDQEDELDEKPVPNEFRVPFYQKPDVKAVFAIRADRLGHLEEIKDLHPSALKNCFELKALKAESALEAIRRPADLPNEPPGKFKSVRFKIEERLLSALVNSLKDEKELIQPSTLQIICWQIEDRFVPEASVTDDPEDAPEYELTFAEFDENDDGNITQEVENIFDNYYRGIIDTKLPENLRDAAFSLVEKILVQSGQRIPFEREYLVSDILMRQFHVAGRKDAQEILDVLTSASLVKMEQDAQRRMIYELGHDTLVEPISRAASLRKEKEEQQRLLDETEKARRETQEAREKEKLARQQAKEFRKLKEEADSNAAIAHREREKAKLRSRIAIFLCIAASIIAFIAYQYKISADTREKEARANFDVAKVFFHKTNQKEAQRLIGMATSYLEYKEAELALQNLNQAKATLETDFDMYLKTEDSASAKPRNATEEILKEIEIKIQECNERLKKNAK